MLENGNAFLYIVQAVVTLAFTYIAVWLFLEHQIREQGIKMVQAHLQRKGVEPCNKVDVELLSQLDEYEPSL